MKKKTFILLTSLLTICAVLTTTVFAVQESGWFRSDTGTGLNLRLDWDVVQPDGAAAAEVSVTAVLQHYSLQVGARTVTLSIGGTDFTCQAAAIHTDDNTVLQEEKLATNSAAFSRAAGETIEVPISASWAFNGTYAGKKIETISAAQTLVISDAGVTVKEDSTTGSAAPAVTTPAAPAEPAQPTETITTPDAVGGPVYSQMWTLRAENGTWLNLICEVQVADSINDTGKLDVTASFYLEHYSLWMSAKTGEATVGGSTLSISAPAVAEESNTLHRIPLGSITLPYSKGETVTIRAELPFNGTYSGKQLDKLTVEGTITLD